MKKRRIISILLFITVMLPCFSSCSYLQSPGSEIKNPFSDASENNKTILVQSHSGTYDLDQQMATFILWEETYSSAYTEYRYTSYGLYEDTNNLLTTYSSAAEYGIAYAANYTQNYLREGLTSISDFLSELVAGADAAVNVGLTFDEHDEEAIADYSTQMQNIWSSSGLCYSMTYEAFLSKYICEDMTEQDIEDTARLVVMYTKYCNYKKLALDAEATTAEIETYIQKNPAGHFVIKYHQYKNASDTFMTKLYAACDKTWNPEATAEEIKDTLDAVLTLSVDKFRLLVVESVVEDKLKDLIISEFITNGTAKEDSDVLSAVIKQKDVTDAEINAALSALKITVAEHKSNETGLNKDISEWIFNSKRVKNDTTIIKSGDSVYLVYTAAAPTVDSADAKVNVVKAGWKEYKYSDYTDKYNDFKPLLLEDLKLYEDSTSEKSDKTQGEGFESADTLVKQAYLAIRGTDADDVWKDEVATLSGFKTNQEIKKPEAGATAGVIQAYLFKEGASYVKDTYHQIDDGDTSYLVRINKTSDDKTVYTVEYATFKTLDDKKANELAKELYTKVTTTKIEPDSTYWDRVVSKLSGYVASETIAEPDYDDDATPIQAELFDMHYEVDDIFIVNNEGTSYLVKVLEKAAYGNSYTVAYATYEDTPYHAIYRSLVSTYTSSYNITETSLTHPSSTTEGSVNKWLCAGEYNEETQLREFDRKVGDVAHFAVQNTDGKETGKYNVCVVSTPMHSNREDKKEITVYGGYRSFDTKEEADAALNKLQGLYGFELWAEFSALSPVTTTGAGENQIVAYAGPNNLFIYSASTSVNKTATIDTALTSTSNIVSEVKELREWLFSDARQPEDRAVIKTSSGSYYLAYFHSSAESWFRTAKDSWVASTMTELFAQMVKEGGYTLDIE